MQVYVEQFSYNVTDAKDCVPAKDNNSEPNCTKVTNGSFTGLGSGVAAYTDVVGELFEGNLWPRFVKWFIGCETRYSRNLGTSPAEPT